ncbi:MAG: hypothetical protein ACKV19_11085 [Verrucomicrobiales bacterium]
MQSNTSNKPVHEVRLGAIKAAIWRDQNSEKPRFNVSVTRIYKDGDKWKNSEYFSRDDLPKLALVSQKAYEWMFSSTTGE